MDIPPALVRRSSTGYERPQEKSQIVFCLFSISSLPLFAIFPLARKKFLPLQRAMIGIPARPDPFLPDQTPFPSISVSPHEVWQFLPCPNEFGRHLLFLSFLVGL